MHCLCASISLVQFSSPFSTMLQWERGKILVVASLIVYVCFSLSLTYHASRARLVSGQAQHALHLGLSPAAAASVVFVADAGAATVSTTATPLDVVLPIIIVAHRRLSYDCYHEKYSEVIRLAVATFAFVGILFM